MRTKELRKHIQQRITDLAERECVLLAVRLHELDMIIETLLAAVNKLTRGVVPDHTEDHS